RVRACAPSPIRRTAQPLSLRGRGAFTALPSSLGSSLPSPLAGEGPGERGTAIANSLPIPYNIPLLFYSIHSVQSGAQTCLILTRLFWPIPAAWIHRLLFGGCRTLTTAKW